MISDSHGNPIDFILSEVLLHDFKIVEELLKLNCGENIIADRSYISSILRNQIMKKGSQQIIPKMEIPLITQLQNLITIFIKYGI